MRQYLAGILEEAQSSLTIWLEGQSNYCDLKRATFETGFPYGEAHMQSLYLLRYLSAYLAETCILFENIKEHGLEMPNIASFGCGCLLDAKAAEHVFSDFLYTGYDMVDWSIKAFESDGGDVELIVGDVFSKYKYYNNINLFHFPRSLGDFGATIDNFHALIRDSSLESNVVYVSATYRATQGGVGFDREKLNNFVSFFEDYDEGSRVFVDGNDLIEQCGGVGIMRKYDWCNAINDVGLNNYCQSIIGNCDQDMSPLCPQDECRTIISRSPTLRLSELAYEFVRLEKR